MKHFALLVVILTVVINGGCKKEPVRQTSASRIYMDTVVSITVVAENKEICQKAIENAFKTISQVDDSMDRHNDKSEVYALNHAGTKAFKASHDLIEVVEKSIKVSEISDGAFDITIATLLNLWKEASESQKKPTEQEIAKAKSLVDYRKIQINRNASEIQFTEDGMSIDLGGIAKGYALEKAAKAMEDVGAIGGLINAGGDIVCFGETGKTGGWKIGVQNPDTNKESLFEVIEMGAGAIATSGDYYRFYSLDGEKNNHIVNPKSGKGAKWFKSVSVIASDGTLADAIATAVSVMGEEKGFAMIELLDGIECMAVKAGDDSEEVMSSGFEDFICPAEH